MTRIAQVLLVVSALALWAASRVGWVDVTSFDGLGQPKSTTLTGAAWSTALIPLALVVLAAAVAALAVHGWMLRLLGGLVAVATVGMGYLGIGLWVIRNVGARAAELAQVPLSALVGTQRHHVGAALTLVAAAFALGGAVLLVRSAARGARPSGRYLAPAAKREAVRGEGLEGASDGASEGGMSERMMWDALDEGLDPTRDPRISDDEGR